MDILASKIEQKNWENLVNMGATDTHAQITIMTNMIQQISIEAHAQIILPSIVDQNKIIFNKTEVGQAETAVVTIINESPHPLEVQFFLASQNYYTDIQEWLFSQSKIPNWVEVCKITFDQDPIEKLKCEEFLKLFELNEDRKKQLIDFFLRNFMAIINNRHIYSDNL